MKKRPKSLKNLKADARDRRAAEIFDYRNLDPHRKRIGTTTIVNLNHVKGCDVYCGRPSKYGNPFIIGRDGNRKEVLIKYGIYLKKHKELLRDAKRELIGRTVGCFCVPEDCHVEILIGAAMEYDG